MRDGTAFTHLSNSNLLCYFYFYFFFSLFSVVLCGWKYFGIFVGVFLLLFFVVSSMMMRLERLKVSFKSKMWLLVTCVTQGRDCLSLSGSLCFALFSSSSLFLNSFHFSGSSNRLSQSYFTCPFFLLFLHFGFHVVSHHSDRYSMCLCNRNDAYTQKRDERKHIYHAT